MTFKIDVDLLEINYWGKPPFFIHYKCIEHEICLFDKNNYPKIGELKINYAYQQNLYTQKVTHIICSMIQKHCGIKLYLCCWSWKLLTNDCLKRNGQTCSWINLQIKDAKIGVVDVTQVLQAWSIWVTSTSIYAKLKELVYMQHIHTYMIISL